MTLFTLSCKWTPVAHHFTVNYKILLIEISGNLALYKLQYIKRRICLTIRCWIFFITSFSYKYNERMPVRIISETVLRIAWVTVVVQFQYSCLTWNSTITIETERQTPVKLGGTYQDSTIVGYLLKIPPTSLHGLQIPHVAYLRFKMQDCLHVLYIVE